MGKSISNNDPLLLGANDNVVAKKKSNAKEQPESDPLVLGASDTRFVKKKADGESSGQNTFPTPSGFEPPSISPENINKAGLAYQNKNLTTDDLSVLAATDFGKQKGFDKLTPDQKQLYVEAHNGTTKEDLFNSVASKINTFYPADNQNPAKTKVRDEILKGVQTGNQDTIIKTRDSIVNNLQQQVNDIYSKSIQEYNGGVAYNMAGGQIGDKLDESILQKSLPADQQQKVQQLKKQIQEVNSSFNDYGRTAIVNSNEVKSWTGLDEKELGDLSNSAAVKYVGKSVHKLYGNSVNSGDAEYDRSKEGLGEIIGNLKMEVRDLISKGLPTKNPDLLKQAKEKINTLERYKKWDDELDTKSFPLIGYANTQMVIQDELADIHHNKLIYSKSDKQDAVNSYAKKNPGWQEKYGHFANDIVGNDVWMSHPGILGGLEIGINRVSGNMARLLGLGTDEDMEQLEKSSYQKGTTKSGASPTKIVYDNVGKAYRELPNENYGSWDINNSISKISQGLPQLAEWILLDKGAGAVVKAGLEGVELARSGAAVNKIQEAGKVSEETQRTLGLIGATYLTSYNGNRKLADDLIEGNGDWDEAKKNVLANILTLSTAAAFKMVDYSPSKFAEGLVAKQAMPDALKILENENFETLSEKGWSAILKDNILPKVKALAKAQAESTGTGIKVGAASVLDQKVKDLVSVLVNPGKAKVSSDSENFNSIVEQTLLMSVVGLPTSIVHGVFEPTTKDALYTAGLYSPQYIDRINKMLDDGTITKEKANTLISVVKTMGEEVVKAGFDTNKDGLPMITRQKKDVAINNFRQRASEAMKESGVDVGTEKVDNEVKENINNIKSENYFTPIEETHVFKSAYDEETGKKLSTMDEIVPEKQYTYEKEPGKSVTTNGAELINHLENEDLYEEKPASKTTEAETKIPEGQDQKLSETEAKTKVDTEKGRQLIQKAIDEGTLKGMQSTLGEMVLEQAKEKPEAIEQFFKEVADQALNKVAPEAGDPSQDAEKTYGKEITDYAKELFPVKPVEEKAPIIVRHGETDANLKKEIQSPDQPLNEKGKEQAKQLGKTLKDSGVTTIITSPFERAKQTADIAAEQSGAKVETSDNLREWNTGDKETFDEFADRIAKERENINNLSPDTAVVTHGNVLKMLEALDKSGGDVEKAKELFRQSKDYGNTEQYYSRDQSNREIKTQEDFEKYLKKELGLEESKERGLSVLNKKNKAYPRTDESDEEPSYNGENENNKTINDGADVKNILQKLSVKYPKLKPFINSLLEKSDKESLGVKIKSMYPDDTPKMASYSTADDKIYFWGDYENNPRIVIHEIIHAMTSLKIPLGISEKYKGASYLEYLKEYKNKNKTAPASKLIDLYTEAIELDGLKEKLLGEKGLANDRYQSRKDFDSYDYGFFDIHEFLSEAFTNHKFQEKLKNLRTGNKSIWDKFVDFIKDIFGVEDIDLLKDVLKVGNEIISSKRPKLSDIAYGEDVNHYSSGSNNLEDKIKNVISRASVSLTNEQLYDSIKKITGLGDNQINNLINEVRDKDTFGKQGETEKIISSQSKSISDGSKNKEKVSQENAPNAEKENGQEKGNEGLLKEKVSTFESMGESAGESNAQALSDLAEIKSNHQKSIDRLEKKGDKLTKKEELQLKRMKDRVAIIDRYNMTSENLIKDLKDKGILEQICK